MASGTMTEGTTWIWELEEGWGSSAENRKQETKNESLYLFDITGYGLSPWAEEVLMKIIDAKIAQQLIVFAKGLGFGSQDLCISSYLYVTPVPGDSETIAGLCGCQEHIWYKSIPIGIINSRKRSSFWR